VLQVRLGECREKLIPNAKEVVITAAGHLLPEADPALFARMITDHITWTNEVGRNSCPE
jgi:pimeloyl-ACP methyl ester carboxylesterase